MHASTGAGHAAIVKPFSEHNVSIRVFICMARDWQSRLSDMVLCRMR